MSADSATDMAARYPYEALVELIETGIFYKLPRLSREEIQTMLQVQDIRDRSVHESLPDRPCLSRKAPSRASSKKTAQFLVGHAAFFDFPAKGCQGRVGWQGIYGGSFTFAEVGGRSLHEFLHEGLEGLPTLSGSLSQLLFDLPREVEDDARSRSRFSLCCRRPMHDTWDGMGKSSQTPKNKVRSAGESELRRPELIWRRGVRRVAKWQGHPRRNS
jgi:hypothetical protein